MWAGQRAGWAVARSGSWRTVVNAAAGLTIWVVGMGGHLFHETCGHGQELRVVRRSDATAGRGTTVAAIGRRRYGKGSRRELVKAPRVSAALPSGPSWRSARRPSVEA